MAATPGDCALDLVIGHAAGVSPIAGNSRDAAGASFFASDVFGARAVSSPGMGPERNRASGAGEHRGPARRQRARARDGDSPAPQISGGHDRRSEMHEPTLVGATHCPTCATGASCTRCKEKSTRTVSAPEDPRESYADRVADAVTSDADMPAASSGAPSTPGRRLPAAVDTQISALRGHGAPVPDDLRQRFEPHLGALDDVRLHVGNDAARLASTLRASAFTVGREIFFARDEYRPDTTDGQRLLAHELAHAVHHGADSTHVHRQPQRTPCQGTSDLPGNPAWRGTYEHVLIQDYYISNINPNAEAEYMIPESGPNGGDAPADLVDPTTGIIFEIKFVGKKGDADAKVLRSIEKASEHCGENIPWHAGTYFPKVELPWLLPDTVLVAKRGKPGVIVYWIESKKRRREEEEHPFDKPVLFGDRLAAEKYDNDEPEDRDQDNDDDDDQPRPPPPVIFDPRTAENLGKTAVVTTALAMAAQTVVEIGQLLATPTAAARMAAVGAGGGGTMTLGGAAATGTSTIATGARASRILGVGSRAGILGAAIAITYLGADMLSRYTYGTIYWNTRGARLQGAYRRLGAVAERLGLSADAAQSMQDQMVIVGEYSDIDAGDSADLREYYLEILYQYRITLAEMFTELQDCAREFSAIEDQVQWGIDPALEQSIEMADTILSSGDRSFMILTIAHSELDKMAQWIGGRLDRLADNYKDVFNRDSENWLRYKR